jgi:hypothetical protein
VKLMLFCRRRAGGIYSDWRTKQPRASSHVHHRQRTPSKRKQKNRARDGALELSEREATSLFLIMQEVGS